jgi:carboxypeptidase C (cathepsin A)
MYTLVTSLRFSLAFTCLLGFCLSPVFAARERDKKPDTENSDSDESKDDKDKDKEKKEEEPKLSVTEHTSTIGGKPVKYKATAGYIVLKEYLPKAKKEGEDSDSDEEKKEEKGKSKKREKPLARVFFIAYTRDDVGNPAKRPVTFTFNGGPGSASVWLHMGGLGPRRAVLTEGGEALPPPYRLEDNAYSWLDESDLVFIDPVSTGYSRAEPGEKPKRFHGYKEDIESVGEFIRLYTTKYQRWTSPKFITGESYGTTRAAGLSDFLQGRYGIYLNGIVLVSTVLNFETLDFSPGNDEPFALFLPSFTAAAWYHKRLAPELQSKPLNDVLKEAEDFAAHDYLLALFQGDGLATEAKQKIAGQVARFTGLQANYVNQLNIRVPDALFFTHLLLDQNREIGRLDSRFTGIRYNPGTDNSDYDPSSEAVNGPFTATFNDYVRRELKFETELPYETVADVNPWSWKNYENRYVNVADDLRKAMSRNPYLKVWICAGHYDLATPYFAALYTVNQMSLDPTIRNNIRLTYYESGHMLYIYKPALQKFKTDFVDFLKAATLPDTAAVPSAARP